MSYKIIELRAENVKRIVTVQIKPEGNLVEITGKNGQGKSSVLDSIYWALAGTRTHQSHPIRNGETEARIKLDLGEIVVRREFALVKGKAEGEDEPEERLTTKLFVESAKGARFPTPQRMLDDMLGSLAFDPLAFSRMTEKEQYEILQRFVEGIDFEEERGLYKRDYDERTELNRTARNHRTAADQLEVPEDVPDELVDGKAILGRIQEAEAHNRAIAEEEDLRRRRVAEISGARGECVDREHEIASLRAQAAELTAKADSMEKENTDKLADLDRQAEEFKNLPPVPEAKDVEPLQQELLDVDSKNAAFRLKATRDGYVKQAEDAETKAAALTTAMKERSDRIKAAVAAADMPVKGLSIGDGEVFLDGVPLAQASDAEQLRLSCAVAMRQRGELSVIRVRDGSLLDEDSMEILRQMAEEHDCQVWIERVDSSGTVGIVMEEGRVKGAATGGDNDA